VTRDLAGYSRCISTNTAIGTPDELADALTLKIEVKQSPFSMAGRTPVFYRGIGFGANYIGVIRREPGPAVVVVRSIFCQV
jgi:hypothetical protein